jgi:DNA-binding beta-propeller fold protein YncE
VQALVVAVRATGLLLLLYHAQFPNNNEVRTMTQHVSIISFLAAFIIAVFGALEASAQAANLYASYLYNSTIHAFGPTGSDLGTFGNTGGEYPEGVAFDTHGNLYVVNSNPPGTIHKFGPSGADLGTIVNGTVLGSPIGIAIDSLDNLYVSDINTHTIRKFGPTGADQGIFASMGLSTPYGLAFDSSGILYVADHGIRPATIHKFSPSGASLGSFGSLSDADGVAFDSHGILYVTDYDNNTIYKFSQTGVDLGVFANTGMNHPDGLAFDSEGNLYVANDGVGYVPTTYANTIHKFGPAGEDLGTFANTGSGTGPEWIAFSPVPELSTFTLAGCGMLIVTLSLFGRRRRIKLQTSLHHGQLT